MYRQLEDALAVASEAGVRASTWLRALLALAAAEEPLELSLLARRVGVTGAAATGMADRLEQLGLVKRWWPANDRRKVQLGLTEAGWKLMEAAKFAVEGRAA